MISIQTLSLDCFIKDITDHFEFFSEFKLFFKILQNLIIIMLFCLGLFIIQIASRQRIKPF